MAALEVGLGSASPPDGPSKTRLQKSQALETWGKGWSMEEEVPLVREDTVRSGGRG